MSNKNLHIFDGVQAKDSASLKGTQIILKETATGKTLFRGSNKVLISGSEFNALKDFQFGNLLNDWQIKQPLTSIRTYDEALSNNKHSLSFPPLLYPVITGQTLGIVFNNFRNAHGQNPAYFESFYKDYMRRVFLFCVGIDGCGIENSRVFKVQNTKWIAPYDYTKFDSGNGLIDESITNCLIPFKVRELANDLDATDRNIYFGRSEVTDNNKQMVSYYFKSFDTTPTIIYRYADDSTDLNNIPDVWKDDRLSEAEVVVQLKMNISPTDCREYFELVTGTNTAKINSISLCTAVPYTADKNCAPAVANGREIYYKDIKPFTKFNFPNESLINTSKGIDITYYLYY
jgi:hypothetical protein